VYTFFWATLYIFFFKFCSHLHDLKARRVECSIFHTEGPQLWSDLRTSLLSGGF